MILYIHIPFCTSKCGYCAFNSSADFFDLQSAYVEALILDLRSSLSKNYELESIYFGGGTPNALPHHYYEKIFGVIRDSVSLSGDCEITTECNPNLITKEWCQALHALGVNRLSLGVQSFFAPKLEFLQREHSGGEIASCIDTIRSSGIENLSIDLIYNTPLDDAKRIAEEIRVAQALEISHLSAYALSIDEGSRFYRIQPRISEEDFSLQVREALEGFGFLQYEVSSYARPKRCRHNLAYWRGEDYIGCGAGAVGCVGGVRTEGKRHIPSYIQSPLSKREEALSQEQRRFERVFLGLRSVLGVGMEDVDVERAEVLLREGKCRQEGDRLVAEDMFLADEIALWLS